MASFPIFDIPLSLNELLEGDENDSEDVDYEPRLILNSPYCNDDDFIRLLNDTPNTFKIISLNCQSLNAKFDILKTYVDSFNTSNSKIDAICLQETWLSEDSDLSLYQLPGYKLISVGKSCSAHSGIAIYLRDLYEFKVLDIGIFSEFWDAQFIEISVMDKHFTKKKLIIGNFYRPPRPNYEHIYKFIDDLNAVFEKLKIYKYVLLAGDFNVNLLNFKNNISTNDLLENIIASGYLPKITVPTRLTQRHGTLIDNFFVKVSDDYSLTTARVLLNNISDHLPYFISLDYFNSDKSSNKFIKIYSSGSENFAKFRNDLRSTEVVNTFKNICQDNSNDSYNHFSGILSKNCIKHFPCKLVRFNKHKHKKSAWITNAIIKSIRYRDKLYVKLKTLSITSHQYQTTSINFKTYNGILQKTIKLAKKQYFANCFQKFKSDIKKTWLTINDIINKTKKTNNYPNEFLVDGNLKSNPETIANEFNKFFIEIGPKLSQKIRTPRSKSFRDFLRSPVRKQFNFQKVNQVDVIKAIDTLKPKTSSGQDKISNKLLKYIKHEVACPLMQIINQTFETGNFPDSLKIAKVTPLFKKNESNMFTNYRPVSVLPSVSKVFERIMHEQIYEHFKKLNLFFRSQYGFRSNHSTEYAALEIVDRIITEMDKNNVPINIYMDLSKAFDTLDHQILLFKLRYYGFANNSFKLLESYLSNRTQYVEMNDVCSDLMEIKCGVPQGSILGPLLFIIYLNDLPSITESLIPIIYADDTTLFATLNTRNIRTAQEDINNELKLVSEWLKLNKLSLNIEKTKAMLFHTSQRHIVTPDIFIDGNKIEFVKEFKFLGLVIDENLSFKQHVNFVSKKISKTIGILARLKNTLPVGVLLNIYHALILPYLTYGISIWGWRYSNLFKMQKKAIRLITNSKYNAHTSILFKQLSILKLNDICTLHDYKLCYKFINCPTPEYFVNILNTSAPCIHSHNTRSAMDIRLPPVRHEFARNGIKYKFSKLFNNMPEAFKSKIYTHSFSGYKNYIKLQIIEKYETVCNISECFVCNN